MQKVDVALTPHAINSILSALQHTSMSVQNAAQELQMEMAAHQERQQQMKQLAAAAANHAAQQNGTGPGPESPAT